MMIMGALGIAAQHPPAGPQACRFYLLDGSPVDSALVRTARPPQRRLAAPRQQRHLARPGPGIHRTGPRNSNAARRRHRTIKRPSNIFIFDVQRFRDIRKSDDDFGYTRYDEDKPVPPSKLFADVLRDGPTGWDSHDHLVR